MTEPVNTGVSPLLQVDRARKDFIHRQKLRKIAVHAVNDVSFEIFPGETFGLVGESGCGKTTTGRMICGLLQPTDGIIRFDGQDLFALKKGELRQIRKGIQIVFQNPFASLDPRITVGKSIEEPLITNHIGTPESRRAQVEDLLERVGLQRNYYSRYPHEFSGGQRQRIGIARALILNPKLIVLDEPVSALDVSVQTQILDLLVRIQEEFQVSFLFISHDLNVVQYISDWVGVMYLGSLVEVIRSKDLYAARHPYTRALLSAVPTTKPAQKSSRMILEGDLPSPTDIPEGCCFHTRCPYAQEICRHVRPEKQYNGREMIACHFPLTK
ncbi:MAG: ATP-binding cassette domain-containing protein [Clostridia bacterium]|nr:ATP-binding cassette domain-containing protein [Clostridia bacterium]